jgi:DNA topoisomerase-1
MAQLFKKIDPNTKKMTAQEKVKVYNECNKEVAVLCNHKRTVGAAHEAQMEKMGDRIKGLRYQKWRTKMMMLDVDPKLKKKKGAEFFELDEDLDEEWILKHQAFLVEEERKKITKKFEKENEKRVADKEKPLPEKELKERLKAANELEAKFKKENKTKKVDAEGRGPTIERLENAIVSLDKRIKNETAKSEDREGNKEVALGTSKLVSIRHPPLSARYTWLTEMQNYIDPRLTAVFCKQWDLPIEKVFPKTMRDKFKWAIEQVGDDTTWEF